MNRFTSIFSLLICLALTVPPINAQVPVGAMASVEDLTGLNLEQLSQVQVTTVSKGVSLVVPQVFPRPPQVGEGGRRPG